MSLNEILLKNEGSADFNMIVKGMKTIALNGGVAIPQEILDLEERLRKKQSYSQQRIQQVYEDRKTIVWDDTRELFNKVDIENMLESIDPTEGIDRGDIYDVQSSYPGLHIPGLDLNMSPAEIKQLIQAKTGHSWVMMGVNKRCKFSEERRNVRLNAKKVEWYKTLSALKQFAKENMYTRKLTLNMVREIASHYYRELSDYYDTLDLNKLSEHLIAKDALRYQKQVFIEPLMNYERKEGEDLNSAIGTALDLFKQSRDLVTASYVQGDPNYDAGLHQFSIDALINLTSAALSAELREKVASARHEGDTIDFNQLLTASICWEEKQGLPKTNLKLKWMSKDNKESTNSIKINNVTIKSPEISSDSNDSSSSSDEEIKMQKMKMKKYKKSKRVEANFLENSRQNNEDSDSIDNDNDIRMDENELTDSKWDYEQARNDNKIMKKSSKYKLIKTMIVNTFNEEIGKKKYPNMIYTEIINRMTAKNYNKRTIAAIFYDKDILDTLYRGKTTHVMKHKIITESLYKSNEHIQTRSATNNEVRINNVEFRKYNTNDGYLKRQNDRSRDRRNRERREVSFDRSKDRRYSYDRYDKDYKTDRQGRSNDKYQNNYQSRSRSNKRQDYSTDRDRSRSLSRGRLRHRSGSNYRSGSRTYNDRNRSESNRRDRSYSSNRRNRSGYYDRSDEEKNYEPKYQRQKYDRSRERRNNRNGRSSKVYRREFSRDRTVSPGVREYMRRGQNCDDDYNPKKKYCSKCKESGHHPFNCQQFKEWRREPCRLCKGHHSERECAERREKILN